MPICANCRRDWTKRGAVSPRHTFAVAANLARMIAAAQIEESALSPRLLEWAKAKDAWLVAIDLMLRLALAVVVEEMMGRRLAWNVLAPRLDRLWGSLVASSMLFGPTDPPGARCRGW